MTCTVRGVTEVLDYWSTRERKLRAMDSCYFVLKKVFIDEETRYQTDLSMSAHKQGEYVKDHAKNKMAWQIVPFNISDNFIPLSAYSWKNKLLNSAGELVEGETSHIGFYWHVGNTHEHADIADSRRFAKRNDLSVAMDISYLHDNAEIMPIHFYLKMDSRTLKMG